MSLSQTLQYGAASLRQRIKDSFFSKTTAKPPSEGRRWELDASQTSAYYRALASESLESDLVDDRTWSDLEMDRVFARLDKSVTPLGAQYLYSLLRNYQCNPNSLEENVSACREFTDNVETGRALRRALEELNQRDTADLAAFLLGPPVKNPKWHRVFYLLSAISVACPFGIFISGWFIFPSMAFWILNVVVHSLCGQSIARHASSLRSLATLLACVRQVSSGLQNVHLSELQNLKRLTEVASDLQKKISLTFLRSRQNDDLTMAIVEYMNILCLFELTSFCRAVIAMNEHRAALVEIFHSIARLDAFQGLSTSLSDYPACCVSEFKAGRTFTLVDAYHPLVDTPIPNTIHGTGNSLLLSGTNMAGKTTFMKTLAINLILAQTIGFCLARKAVVPRARVKTLIERQDTLALRQSYFYFEAEQLLRMLADADRSEREHWFVIDEIFRGTNSIERVAAGTAVLSHLTSRGVVVASTHDHELASLLRSDFDSYHFSEVVTDRKPRFDYLLRNGPCNSRNAIKLLVLAGYPKHITDMADRLAQPASIH